MDSAILDQQNTASRIQWSAIEPAVGAVRRSVQGPLLYILYTAELDQLIAGHRLHIQYADDSQVYISVLVSDVQAAVNSFAACVHDVNEWMRASRLRLNPSKTQVMWMGSSRQLVHVDIRDIPVLAASVPVVESAREPAELSSITS